MVEKQSSDSVKNYPPTFEWRRELVFVRRRDELGGGGGTFIFLARMFARGGRPLGCGNLVFVFIFIFVLAVQWASGQPGGTSGDNAAGAQAAGAAPSASAAPSAKPSANKASADQALANQTRLSKASASKVAAIKSFRIVQEKDGPAVEILATLPIVPTIQQIENPTRLVIDVPNARLEVAQRRISVQADQISTLRADQFQENPPVARVVLDLLAPRNYKWDAAGNRLVIHLGKNPSEPSRSPFQPPTVASLTPGPKPVVKAVRAAGPLVLVSNEKSVGSSFTAGADTAVLSLSSGGELHVCPGTTVSITPSQNKHNLLLGMNTGALETHMNLDESSDSIMTPDFRILLVGPGEFHYAFSADSQGNTCVRALPGNTASAIVNELMGDRNYQVKATDQLVFRGGKLDRVDMAVPLECGCPPPRPAIDRAGNDLPEQNSATSAAVSSDRDPKPQTAAAPSVTSGVAAEAEIPPAGERDANELHVQVSAPLVFTATGPPPAPVEDVRALPLDSRQTKMVDAVVAPAPPAGAAARPASGEVASANRPHGFFHKIGRFFSSLFR